ncbi:zinc ribbon domain-containing protein [Crassaminicella indica]|uniref:Zinc ribbon domain-containing protein n=1 Tax=Crassaminicella indica TaxID=2855394 RepID=A0ABX8RHK7_9CLOT|nr:zinc ribbon domain-containing protein [Crassaminicella indica]QXM07210.1 zinc ribbon domain-containing protein [Crassaminicella indica]
MNILNKVKQGMLDSTKAIKEISSDVTELTKLKIALSKDLTRIEELYYDLGKKMYALFEKDPHIEVDEEVSSSLIEIKATLERTKEYQLKIESLKGIIKCEQCGYEVDENDKYCSNCGNKLKLLILEKINEEAVNFEEADENKEVEHTAVDDIEKKPE